jgi:O-succinylbenzoate synthase
MKYRFKFRLYQRQFGRSLSTSHGDWKIREGIILRLIDASGKVGWGEIAPLPWFGSESLDQALDFCRQMPDEITTETIFSIPDELPCCQFGFESAVNLGLVDIPPSQIAYSALLPTGKAALDEWEPLWNQGYRTFKWKIGVTSIEEEMQIFDRLIQVLPMGARLRLDANGGLSFEEANEWLKVSDRLKMIEFLEQPLGVSEFETMRELSDRYSTAIALDESVATIAQLQTCYQQGWRGVFVIKPSIAGSPKRLRQFCQTHKVDAVFSSVFETTIGRQAALNLAAELGNSHRSLGFGVDSWFNEDDETWLQKFKLALKIHP